MVKSKKRKNNRFTNIPTSLIKKIMLIVIAIASIAIILGVVVILFFTNEKMVQYRITTLANDYFEKYFYENLVNSEKFKQIKDLDSAMEKYHTNGLSPITLADLLLYDNQKNEQYRNYLTKYCDENNTYIKFYMDPPYERTSYHYDISYSCNF